MCIKKSDFFKKYILIILVRFFLATWIRIHVSWGGSGSSQMIRIRPIRNTGFIESDDKKKNFWFFKKLSFKMVKESSCNKMRPTSFGYICLNCTQWLSWVHEESVLYPETFFLDHILIKTSNKKETLFKKKLLILLLYNEISLLGK